MSLTNYTIIVCGGVFISHIVALYTGYVIGLRHARMEAVQREINNRTPGVVVSMEDYK